MKDLIEKAEQVRTSIDINIFKGYDIRGDAQITNESPKVNLSAEDAFLIGQSLASGYTRQNQTPRFILTADHRPTSATLQNALAQGAQYAGAIVTINEEPAPTGATSWTILKKRDEYDVAIQITGSHNPYYNNGFKITSKQDSDGNPDVNGFPQALYGENLKQIYYNIINNNVTAQPSNKIIKTNFVNSEYEQAILEHFQKILRNQGQFKKKFRVILDAGNGLGCKAVNILRSLNVEVYEMFTELHGEFPNHPADPSKADGIKMAQDKVLEFNKNLSPEETPWVALVFDGDGDRSGIIGEDGKVIYPEQILAIFYIRFLLENKKGFELLSSLKETIGLALDVRGTAVVGELIDTYREEKNYGIVSEFIPCGYPNHRSYVRTQIEKLSKIQDNVADDQKALLEKIKLSYTSAEASGHFFYATCSDAPQAMVDDGIFSAIKLLEIVDSLDLYEAPENFIDAKENYQVIEIFQKISWRPVSNEIRGGSPYEDDKKEEIITNIKNNVKNYNFLKRIIHTIDVDGIRVIFEDNSFFLVRASQTSPKFTYKFEAQTWERLCEIIQETITFLQPYEKEKLSIKELQEELTLLKDK